MEIPNDIKDVISAGTVPKKILKKEKEINKLYSIIEELEERIIYLEKYIKNIEDRFHKITKIVDDIEDKML